MSVVRFRDWPPNSKPQLLLAGVLRFIACRQKHAAWAAHSALTRSGARPTTLSMHCACTAKPPPEAMPQGASPAPPHRCPVACGQRPPAKHDNGLAPRQQRHADIFCQRYRNVIGWQGWTCRSRPYARRRLAGCPLRCQTRVCATLVACQIIPFSRRTDRTFCDKLTQFFTKVSNVLPAWVDKARCVQAACEATAQRYARQGAGDNNKTDGPRHNEQPPDPDPG